MTKFICPECSGTLSMTRTLDYDVDPDTGLISCPTIDNFIHCDCGWDSTCGDGSEIPSLIIDENLKKDLL